MPADDTYDIVDEKAKALQPVYGCHNGERPVLGAPVPCAGGATYPYRFSTECRYDLSMKDNRCTGCKHAKPFEDWHTKKETNDKNV